MTTTSAFEEVALDYCDWRSHLVPPGTTRPYTADRRYRACAECVDAMRAEVAARERYCPTCDYGLSVHLNGRCPVEHEARAAHGDR